MIKISIVNREVLACRYGWRLVVAAESEILAGAEEWFGGGVTLCPKSGVVSVAGTQASSVDLDELLSFVVVPGVGRLGLSSVGVLSASDVECDESHGRPTITSIRIPASEPSESITLALSALAKIRHGNHFFLFQSVKNLSSGEILYAEALSRIRSSSEVLMPSGFVSSLERVGMIGELDCCAVAKALRYLKVEKKASIGVNVSACSVRNSAILRWLESADVEVSVLERLVVELTESMALDAGAKHVVNKLRQSGVKVAIDDLGAGYSAGSLRHLGFVDFAKIDAKVLREARTSLVGRKRFEDLLELSKNSASEVILEGVESQEDASFAIQAGVSWLQGFFVAHPVLQLEFGSRA